MPVAIDRILISLSLVLLLTLFIGAHAMNIAYADHALVSVTAHRRFVLSLSIFDR